MTGQRSEQWPIYVVQSSSTVGCLIGSRTIRHKRSVPIVKALSSILSSRVRYSHDRRKRRRRRRRYTKNSCFKLANSTGLGEKIYQHVAFSTEMSSLPLFLDFSFLFLFYYYYYYSEESRLSLQPVLASITCDSNRSF